MELEELKKYLKIENDEDDTLIETLQVAGEEYLANAGIKKSYSKKLYTLAVKLLVTHWYQNRMIQGDKSTSKLSFSLDAIIMQLNLDDEVTLNEDTSSQEQGG